MQTHTQTVAIPELAPNSAAAPEQFNKGRGHSSALNCRSVSTTAAKASENTEPVPQTRLAAPEDYREYFGVPPRTMAPAAFNQWARSITEAVNSELDQAALPTGERDLFREGMNVALMVLSMPGGGTVCI